MSFTDPFHSAVNRVPVLRERAHSLAEQGELSPHLFTDHAPRVGHDHLSCHHWSGSIDLEITTRTPLVYGNQGTRGDAPFVELPTTDNQPAAPDGSNLLLPPTMLKGSISRAYELLTASRFRVFGDHSKQLIYRADPSMANGLFPGRIYFDDEINDWAVEVLNGSGEKNEMALIQDCLDGAAGRIVGGDTSRMRRLQEFRELTQHGSEIVVTLTKKKNRWYVTHVQRNGRFEEFFRIQGDGKQLNIGGFPVRTAPDGRDSASLFEGKKYERFFFKTKAGSSDTWVNGTVLRLDAGVVENYIRVLRSYREMHETPTGSDHLLNRAARTLPPSDGSGDLRDQLEGALVFLRLDRDRVSNTWGQISNQATVLEILPTMVGRRTYSKSPLELAKAQQVTPLSRPEEASAADRLFGWVLQTAVPTGNTGGQAFRSRIEIGVIRPLKVDVGAKVEALSPLLSPKTTAGRRFLTDSEGKTPHRKGRPVRRRDLYTEGQLLGAASYPVHRKLLDAREFPPSAQVKPTMNGREVDGSKVQITPRNYVAAGSKFACTLRFTNLLQEELAALVWLLTPSNLVPQSKRTAGGEVGFLQMGLGKPLGLGAIEVRIAQEGLKAMQGQTLAGDYSRLKGCLGLHMPTLDPEVLIGQIDPHLRNQVWVKALQRSAFGYTGEDSALRLCIPTSEQPRRSTDDVRYMSLEENKENNKTEGKGKDKGFPKRGRGLAPRDLSE